MDYDVRYETDTLIITDATEDTPANVQMKLFEGCYDHLKTEGQVLAGHMGLLLTCLTMKKYPGDEAKRRRLFIETCLWMIEQEL